MSKKQILFILSLPPPVHGASMMGKYIQESSLVNETFGADYINLSTSSGLDNINKIEFGKFFSLFKILRKVIAALFKKKYDLCYMTLTAGGNGFYKDLFAVVVLKLFNKKIVYHFHNKGFSGRNNWFTRQLYKLAFRNTKSILLSELLYADIKDFVRKENVFICHNGIPALSNQRDYDFETADKDGEPCRLLFLSNLMKEKGVFVLLDACRKLKEMNVPFVCDLAGPFADIGEEELKNYIATSGLGSNINILGKKFGEQKIETLQKADVFVFPTYYHRECFPLVLLEAMQFSLPVVSTFEGGIADIVTNEETGYLVPGRDAVQLAEKLALLIKNPVLRKQFGRAGFKKYKENFELGVFERRFSTVLEDVITAW